MALPRVVQITDGSVAVAEILSRIDRGGPGLAVQLRSPELSARALLDLGRLLRARTLAVGSRLFVNDRLDLALLLEADGIHLGRSSVAVAEARRVLGSACFVTRSAHDDEELEQAHAEGADAAVISPIFSSPGKGRPLGLEAIRRAKRRRPDFPVFALGGVTVANAPSCLEAGASGVQAIRHDLAPLLS